MNWTTLCEIEELAEKEGRYVEIDGYRLAVFVNGGVPYAMDDRCPHAGASLSSGVVMFNCAICPAHGWAFELKDGVLRGGIGEMVRTYPTRVHEYKGRKLVQAQLPSV